MLAALLICMPKTIPIYQVDAFTQQPFQGNPAAICPLDAWLDDALMQNIAAENNLSETAFCVATKPGHYQLRWFTPTVEIDLCGHATLATAWVLFNDGGETATTIRFDTRSGPLQVSKQGELLSMDFPQIPVTAIAPNTAPAALTKGLRATPVSISRTSRGNYLVEFARQADVAALKPDFAELAKLTEGGVIATALADRANNSVDDSAELDFVSRFFAPAFGIDEDPVTGSAHCSLAPYWAQRLHKPQLRAAQISARGGTLMCELTEERVKLSGYAVKTLQGQLFID